MSSSLMGYRTATTNLSVGRATPAQLRYRKARVDGQSIECSSAVTSTRSPERFQGAGDRFASEMDAFGPQLLSWPGPRLMSAPVIAAQLVQGAHEPKWDGVCRGDLLSGKRRVSAARIEEEVILTPTYRSSHSIPAELPLPTPISAKVGWIGAAHGFKMASAWRARLRLDVWNAPAPGGPLARDGARIGIHLRIQAAATWFLHAVRMRRRKQ